MADSIRDVRELRVYQEGLKAAMAIFELTRVFPVEERYALTDQIRRSSRSVCANLGEAWRKRRYQAAFVAKLNDVESEACETQVWLEFAVLCGYVSSDVADDLRLRYDKIPGQVVCMIRNVEKWTIG